MRIALSAILALFFTSCSTIEQKVSVVENFELKQYLGTWYEIARLDHSFERNMDNVSAYYELDKTDLDKVLVINSGFNTKTKKWHQAKGKAYFIDGSDKGLLKVSFFGPFYGAYQIHDLVILQDGTYSDALILGPDNTYAWILSKQKYLNQPTKERFLLKLENLGVDTNKLIWVNQ